MLLNAEIDAKIMGSELLLSGLNIRIENGEKIGVIGRNGVGKTTLFNILNGSDQEFDGQVNKKRNAVIVSTRQEHHEVLELSPQSYIIQNLPEYRNLKNIIDTFPDSMGSNIHKIHQYSEALERFGQLGFYDIEQRIDQALQNYQIDIHKSNLTMKNLSGGQKRFVELIRVQFSNPDLALIDEPTNHMDYVAKQAFIEWLGSTKHACLVITHDRDVLQNVDKIFEIKDSISYSYKGNYEAYLKQNTHNTTNQMQNYEIAQKTMVNLKKQIMYAKSKKPSWSGTADQKNPFVVMELRLTKRLKEVEAANPKPSFWIDQESASNLKPTLTDQYQKYKAKNIRLNKQTLDERSKELLVIDKLCLGYSKHPLFKPMSFNLSHGQRLQLIGRNGAGKTTLVREIINRFQVSESQTYISGTVELDSSLRLSVYEQEISPSVLELTLYEAIERAYYEQNIRFSSETIMRAMGDYLFEVKADGQKKVMNLSGGQKARLQLIKMLAGKPNLLILDEPTNHLDLPSIEELESALTSYEGAILYISHDSFFSKNIGGQAVSLVSEIDQ